jgi:hypothetical protein
VSEALVVTMDGRRSWIVGVAMVEHLRSAMHSIASAWIRRHDAGFQLLSELEAAELERDA